jgi:hypothetical protein
MDLALKRSLRREAQAPSSSRYRRAVAVEKPRIVMSSAKRKSWRATPRREKEGGKGGRQNGLSAISSSRKGSRSRTISSRKKRQ